MTATDALRSFAIDHVGFCVGDAARVSHDLVTRYGFVEWAVARTDEARSSLVGRGNIRLVLTEGLTAGHPAARYVERHGDGVADIALATSSAAEAFTEAVRRGAEPVRSPVRRDGFTTAVIGGFGDIVHTLVERAPTVDPRALPGLEPGPAAPAGSGANLHTVDHLAVCLEPGWLQPTVEFYRDVLGFASTFVEKIRVGAQQMNSEVVQSPSRSVTLTLIEPDPTAVPGQIDEFLKNHGGPGVQHVALATDDIVTAVRDLVSRGVVFLNTPAAYYEDLPRRLHVHGHSLEAIQELGILADADRDGELFQIFARSTHPANTFFFEIIERDGAATFGSRNIKALYTAVARDSDGVTDL
jgi:4-hydroxymandelate synthase